jgi:predicted aspartyl protease
MDPREVYLLFMIQRTLWNRLIGSLRKKLWQTEIIREALGRRQMLLRVRSGGAMAALLAATVLSLPAQAPVHSAPMIERYGKPYVMVTINGKGPYRFVIDTGTGADAFVTPELADELQLPAAAETVLNDPSKQGGQRVPMVLLPSVEIAGLKFYWVEAIRHEVTGEAGSCQGLLGFALFRDYLLTLDFPNRQVLLTEGALSPDGEKTVLPFRMQDGVPITSLRVNGQSVEAQLDSGGGGLTLPEELAAQQKWEIAPVVFATGQTMTTHFKIKAAKLASDITVGKYTFTHPVVEIHPAFPLVNFGSPPMQSFAITFDQNSLLLKLDADRDHFTLTAPPSPTRLTHQPNSVPQPPRLVPVG